MKKITILLLLACLASASRAETAQIGVPITKPTVFSFEEEIIDIDLGNQDYHVKLRGKSLLIFAKKQDSRPTTLFVLYGKNKETYVAEIYPDDQAPLQRFIKAQVHETPTTPTQQPVIKSVLKNVFFASEKQEYFSYGTREEGIKAILVNVSHHQDITYLRFFLENNTTTNLKLAHFGFEYITYLRKFLFFRSTKTKVVEPIGGLPAIELAPSSSKYFVVALPSYTSNGGLEVFLGESGQGEREFRIHVPSRILLKAKRK
ncbi:hypothetical protein [Candidatus Amoebophilus asiaticus]|nr:hypothetical protein [Candidatus Amoebophilus asiaticus]